MAVTGAMPWPRPPMPPCPPLLDQLPGGQEDPVPCPSSHSLICSPAPPPLPPSLPLGVRLHGHVPLELFVAPSQPGAPPGRIEALHSLLPFVCFVLAEGIEARRFEAAVMPTSSPSRPRIAVTLAVVPCGPRTNRPRRMPASPPTVSPSSRAG